MNSLEIFKNDEFGNVRVVMIEGEPWFVGKDVADVLGYKDTVNAIKAHVDNDDKRGWQITTPSGNQEAVVINESGLFSLILSSKLPNAKRFKKWVTSEVLPQIRKTGAYGRNTNKALRDKSKQVRNRLTKKCQEHGYVKPYEYIQTTLQMKKPLGITAKKDDMTERELSAVMASEALAEFLITDEYGFHEVNPVCVEASQRVRAIADEKRIAISA